MIQGVDADKPPLTDLHRLQGIFVDLLIHIPLPDTEPFTGFRYAYQAYIIVFCGVLLHFLLSKRAAWLYKH